jgi:hypothetical protein
MKWRIFLYASAVVFAAMAAVALLFYKSPLESREIIYLAPPPFTDDDADARVERKMKPFLEESYLGDVNIKGAKEALLQLDWVEFAAVRRRSPSTIAITIKPKKIIGSVAFAGGTFMPIDARGRVINERFTESFSPVVSGDGAPAKLPRLLVFLSSYPELRVRLKSANLVDGLRWDLIIAGKGGDVLIRLPADDADKALDRVVRQGWLLEPILEIDIRAGTKIFVKER